MPKQDSIRTVGTVQVYPKSELREAYKRNIAICTERALASPAMMRHEPRLGTLGQICADRALRHVRQIPRLMLRRR